MAAKYFIIVLVFPVRDMPKIVGENYEKAVFFRFKDDDFKQKFDKLKSDNSEYTFLLCPDLVEKRESSIDKVLLEEKITSAFIYENVDGKDVVSLIKGDSLFLKYFQ